MKRLKTAIIGCGGIANRHASVLSGLERVELVAFCDAVEERARDFANRYSQGRAKVYSDYARMYDQIGLDLVYICLPPFAHKNEVELAAERGAHIFIEKPIALDMETAEGMVESVVKAKVKSQVGFMFRFGEAVETIKGMLENGQTGPPGMMMARYMCNSLHAPWWRDKSKSGGQVVEQIIHTYDLARYLLGEVETVYCRMANTFHVGVESYTSEDVSGTVLTFRNGAIATISATNGAIPRQWVSQFELVAKNYTAIFTDSNNALIHQTNMPWPKTISISSQKDIYLAEALDLLSAMEKDGETRTPIWEGAKTLQLVLAVRKSGETGQSIKL